MRCYDFSFFLVTSNLSSASKMKADMGYKEKESFETEEMASRDTYSYASCLLGFDCSDWSCDQLAS